jgi:hypothetical protein
MIPTPKNVFQLLAESAENNNGRTLQPSQVREVVAVLQAMQYEIADLQVRGEALTRFTVVLTDHLGGDIVLDGEQYTAAETKGIQADWSEEGDEIALSTYDVDMPGVLVGDDSTDDGGEPDLAPVPEAGGAEGEVEGPAPDADAPVESS